MGFWIGFAIGLIVAWNLFPQPKFVQDLYAKAKAKIQTWLPLSIILISVFTGGCRSGMPFTPIDIGHAKERAMAEIAIVTSTSVGVPAPSVPKVGNKCPDCNDPPGACGVGKTGDGRTCSKCGLCNGDGKIDESDVGEVGGVNEIPVPVPDPVPNQPVIDDQQVVEVQKEILLHVPFSKRIGWASSWFANDREAFEKRGWIVRFVVEPDSETKVAYYDVIAPDGEVLPFFTPLTIEDIEHLETR